MGFKKGHKIYSGSEKGWFKKEEHRNPKTEFKKNQTPWNKEKPGRITVYDKLNAQGRI